MTTSCASLNDSLQLGAATGAIAGGVSQYSSLQAVGASPTLEDTFGAAAIGMGIGLLGSYLLHQNSEQARSQEREVPEMYFGDLPPSPFQIPNIKNQGGRR